MKDNIIIDSNKITKDTTLSVMSDFHYTNMDFSAKYLEYVLKKIKLIKPDYICIPGDIFDSSSNIDIPHILQFFSLLLEYCNKDIVITLGDSDISEKDEDDRTVKGDPKLVYEYLSKLSPRIKVLKNKLYTTEENIRFIGIFANFFYYNQTHEDDEHAIVYFNYLLENINSDSFNTLLFHSPVILKDEIFNAVKALQNIDLALFGHYLGGMVPDFLKPYMERKYGNKQGFINPQGEINPLHCYGFEQRGNLNSYVSSGICKRNPREGFKAKAINTLYKPDIQTIELKKRIR